MTYMQGLNGSFMEESKVRLGNGDGEQQQQLLDVLPEGRALGGETGKLAGTVELKHYI